MNPNDSWTRFKQYLCVSPSIGLRLDISRMAFDDAFIEQMREPMGKALDAMRVIESGAVANAGENRMVGHYWLRAPELAPQPAIAEAVRKTVADVKRFAADVLEGRIKPPRGDGFYVVLVIGIGGSALGPQFLADALGQPDDPVVLRFLDNTDPDGIHRVLAELDESLAQTLSIVISKSGGTKETRNAMVEVKAAYQRAGLDFGKHAVAVTSENSALAKLAGDEAWLHVFPMWDWVGGRTSVTSAVGLLPAALQGLEIDRLLAGARDCDAVTREPTIESNPAAMLALMWHYAGGGSGRRDMVILPYRDRLCLLGRYLQQLVMESLGKERDRDGNVVHQGLSVYGNKGSTDQHAYVQQLREGINNFFVTFIEVLRNRDGESSDVEPGITAGDYLSGFLHGTRQALTENSRESITITLDRLDAYSVGVLIALFERAVGLYAELINVNAYDQPGVEAGKKAASTIISLQRRILEYLRSNKGTTKTVDEIAAALGADTDAECVFHVLQHLAADENRSVKMTIGTDVLNARYEADL